jgi:FxsC-like protein
MAYEFFFSYTRANNDAYLQRFFEDLSAEVRLLRGVPATTPVGFFDQRELELGEDWDQSIVEALSSSRVVLAAASAAYFKSEYCGKELALFARRLPAALPDAAFPPVIKPLVWGPFKTQDTPPVFQARQFTFGDPQAIHNTKGIRYLMKQMREHEVAYNDIVSSLAQEIVNAADANPLPSLQSAPALREVASWWQPAAPASVPPSGPEGSEPNRVHFIYVAADPKKFGGARLPDPYVEAGGSDWKPFFPDTRRIHRFMQSVVASDELDFTSDEVPFSRNLVDEIEAAWKRRHIVVLVVDGWSLHWDAQSAAVGYQAALQALDRRNDYHWCVLVPWNEQDPDLVANRATVEQMLGRTFPFHGQLARNPMFYRDGIKDFGELKVAVSEVLTRLKDEIRKHAPITMPMPAGPSKSVISGSAP